MKLTIEHDTTLLEALALLAPGSSKTAMRSWLKEGRVFVDGDTQKIASSPIAKGQIISLGAKLKRTDEGEITILYEDKHIVVINKPVGMLSVSTAFEKGNTAHGFLKKNYKPKKVFVVHRLDQDTSGVMLFALTEDAYLELKKMFEKHDLERAYTAIIEGKLDQSAGTWKSYLYEDGNYVVHETDDPLKGKLAVTHYTVLKSSSKFSLLHLRLETGKKNQIRVHCQSAGHSIVGDKKYGATSNSLKRLCLHAHYLSFMHPITGQKMRFEAPLPEEFKRLDVGS